MLMLLLVVLAFMSPYPFAERGSENPFLVSFFYFRLLVKTLSEANSEEYGKSPGVSLSLSACTTLRIDLLLLYVFVRCPPLKDTPSSGQGD
uniref:Putative secreted protein n=1 Tax=Anopheles darlingi TaxID=43151 RepID=A0A2M4DQ70_ANODA